ncbi:MAG: hypothetical protein LBC40_05690 [Dysgonamonadaceae bacterium]|jgi:hypothetical protein|nr:hypothetical protein [Dysgonamonadaceae bacterium]
MKTLKLNEDLYEIPGTWNELTMKQLVFLIHLTEKPLTAEEIKLKMLLFCLPAHVRRYRTLLTGALRYTVVAGKHKYYEFSAEEMLAVCDLFSFLFSGHDKKLSIHPQLTVNPFRTTRCGCHRVYGPDDALMDITYEEFAFLLTYFQHMQSHPDAIHDFLSVIYRTRRDRECGKRNPEMMRKMSPTVKTAALWHFLGAIQFLAEKFPRTFSGGEPSSGNVFESQMRVIDALASNDVTKKETVKKSLLYDALYTMECAAENAEKMKK